MWKAEENRIKRETRTAIYNEGLRLFREQGVENTPVSQITDNVGIAKGTFFRYFQTKDHLILAFYRDKFSVLLEKLRKINYMSAYDAFLDMGLKIAETLISERTLFLYNGRSKKINREIAAEEKSLNMELEKYCNEIFVKFAPPITEYEKKMYIDIIIALLTASYHDWRISEGYTDLPQIIINRSKFLYKVIARGTRHEV